MKNVSIASSKQHKPSKDVKKVALDEIKYFEQSKI